MVTKVIGNWVKESVSGTPGTATTVTLVAITGFSRVQDIPELTVGATVKYVFEDGNNREYGLGTRQAGSTFDRTTPQATLDAGTYDNTSPAKLTLTSSAKLYLAAGSEDWTEMEQLAFVTGATYNTIQDAHNIINSTGLVGTHTITDDTDGTITVSAGSGFIRATNSDVVELKTTDWAAEAGANVNLVDNDLNYIYVEYNSGTPQVIATVTKRTDLNTNIFLGTVYRIGTALHITTQTAVSVGAHIAKMDARLSALNPFARASGAVISETGTRNIAITAGDFWEGLDNFTTAAKDTNVADTFIAYYSDGAGGFTAITAQTQMNNTQYDDGSGTLATLANNRYGVCWVYISVEGDLYVVFGTASYTLVDAEAAPIPSSIPPHFEGHSRIVGKVIVLKNASSLQAVESAFTETFTTGLPTDHGDLIGLADDDHTQYLLVDGTRAATKFEFTNEIYRTGASVLGTATNNHVNLGGNGSITGTAGIAWDFITIGGGDQNEALKKFTTVSGGQNNKGQGEWDSLGGGFRNTVSSNYGTIPGGTDNIVSGQYGTCVGGITGIASGRGATSLGAKGNEAVHDYSVASCGASKTRANFDFVIGYVDSAVGSVANNSIRFQGIGGNILADGSLSTPEADLATMVEWADGNPNNEDRDGLFVTIVNTKLVLGGAVPDGIISSTPSIIGNAAPNKWVKTFLRDPLKRVIKKTYTIVEWVDEWGDEVYGYECEDGILYKEYPQPTSILGIKYIKTPIGHIKRDKTEDIPVVNPLYDHSKAADYKARKDREEWGIMGYAGQIICISSEQITENFVDHDPITGIIKNGTTYKVMEIIDKSHTKILFTR